MLARTVLVLKLNDPHPAHLEWIEERANNMWPGCSVSFDASHVEVYVTISPVPATFTDLQATLLFERAPYWRE